MPVRSAKAQWEGNLTEGRGKMRGPGEVADKEGRVADQHGHVGSLHGAQVVALLEDLHVEFIRGARREQAQVVDRLAAVSHNRDIGRHANDHTPVDPARRPLVHDPAEQHRPDHTAGAEPDTDNPERSPDRAGPRRGADEHIAGRHDHPGQKAGHTHRGDHRWQRLCQPTTNPLLVAGSIEKQSFRSDPRRKNET